MNARITLVEALQRARQQQDVGGDRKTGDQRSTDAAHDLVDLDARAFDVAEDRPGALHESLAETRLIPDLALEMIEVGEASGALAAMLTSVAEFYEEEVSTRLQRTLIWVSPAILVVMAIVVGFILISLYLPLFSLQVGTGG